MKPGSTIAELNARYGPRYRWILMGSVMVGAMASIMSSTIINVAIPGLSHQFHLGQERAQWVSSGFMVAMTIAMLTTPWLLSRFGYRDTYLGTMVLLMAGGIAGGLSDNYSLVLVARVVEGLAAGAVQPIPAIIMMRAFEPSEQGRAGGLFGMGVVLAPAIGPSIGGVLVDLFGWRSIFFMVVPFCLASIWLAMKYVPVSAPGGVAAERGAALDWRGLLLAAGGTLCLLNGLVELHAGSKAPAVLLLLAAAGAVAAFIWWQRRAVATGLEPLMNLALFSHRAFTMGSIVSFIYGIALFGSTYLLPVYMLLGLKLSASHVGTIMLPSGLALAFTIPAAARLVNRVPIYLLVTGGLALLAASFALMPTVGLAAPLTLLVAWAILGRIGLGFIVSSLNLGSLRALDKDMVSWGASTINFMRMLGGAAGVSLCGIVLEWRLSAHGDSLTNPETSPARIAAFNEAFFFLAAVCCLAIVAAWQLRAAHQAVRA